MRLRASITSLLIAISLGAAARADNWPGFRGPTGLGYAPEKNLPLNWGGKDRQNVLWSANLTGEGHASPIVWGDRVFACTVKWPGERDAKVMPEHHVTCYSAKDGNELWDVGIDPGPWLRNDFRSGAGGGYAAPTPCTDGQHVFVVFGSAVMAALDFDGHIVWRKELRPYTFDVTVGSSPVLFQDTIILLCAMAKPADSRLVAFNKSDGSVKWETKLSTVAFGHSTPLLIDVNGRKQMLVLASGMKVAPDGLQGFDPATGQRLWWCRGGGDASSPAYGAGIVYFDSGRGGPGFAVDPTGSGDVSKTHVKWTVPQVPEGIGSPVIVGDCVYRLHSPGILKCWKAATGEQVYSKRLEGITSTWASPIADRDGNLIFASGGRSVVVKTGPAGEIVATNDLGDPNDASAAVSDGRIYILGKKRLYCIAKP
jgi:outer membrane protein assembly factor BamB